MSRSSLASGRHIFAAEDISLLIYDDDDDDDDDDDGDDDYCRLEIVAVINWFLASNDTPLTLVDYRPRDGGTRHMVLHNFGRARETVTASFQKALHSYVESDASKSAVDNVQRKFSCCGVNGPTDWLSPSKDPNESRAVASAAAALSLDTDLTFDLPVSCCPSSLARDIQCSTNEAARLFQQGCLVDILDWVRWILLVSGWAIFSAACTQILGLAVVCCFTRATRFIYG
ncbi:tetraspanin [Plakobranchus ocellatus]|uniref:Tetraspanin n=1 Tax=Plakobranchus ocellatus TaxID=259542 RepID=A0AAV4CH69_9GAST|nr:tetraspanin [Plakobranchus ocellatus]